MTGRSGTARMRVTRVQAWRIALMTQLNINTAIREGATSEELAEMAEILKLADAVVRRIDHESEQAS